MSILALDVGGTHLRSAWIEESELVDDLCIRVDLSSLCAKAVERAERQLVDILLSHIRDRLDQRPAHAVALGMPGFINSEGVIVSSPNLPGIQNFALHQSLQTAIGLPVIVANDALCAVQGAWLLENPRPRSLAILTLGTGVGGGLVLDGRPVVGDNGTAMEIGHFLAVPNGFVCGCGKRGCLEQYASATALTHLDSEMGGPGRSAERLALAARRGEVKAKDLFNQAGAYLGQAVATLVMLVDVRTVRFGGGMSRSWDLLEEGFYGSMEEHLIPSLRGCIDIASVPATAIDRIGLIGAADLVSRGQS